MAESLKRLNPRIRPARYEINIAVDPDQAEFSASCDIDIACEEPQAAMELHGIGFTFDSVQLLEPDGTSKPGKAEAAGQGILRVSFNSTLPAGNYHLRFGYRAPFAAGLEGLYRARTGSNWGAFTQFQALGARRAFPCFDEPAFKAHFAITLRVPLNCEALSNEREIYRNESEGVRTIRFAPTQLLSTYQVAIAVGQFDLVSYPPIPTKTVERDPLPLRGIARQGQGKNLVRALDWTAAIVQELEAYFGMPYPFSKLDFLAVPDFAAGGMENAGLIMYEESLILIDKDSGFEQYRELLTTHAHEIAHQWVGNLVTPAWWDDLWLNESFATFMEARISHILEPGWSYDTDLQENGLDAMQLDLLPSVSKIHRLIGTPDDITTAFDAITYQKGAVALAMLESEMGAAAFQSATQKLLRENRFGTYDTGKFLSAFNVKSRARDNKFSFIRLIDQTGIPERVETNFITRNETAPSYARAKLTPRRWAQVFEDVKHLNKTAALRAAISLDLALQSREISLADYLDGVKALAAHESWKVAGFPVQRLTTLIAELPQAQLLKTTARAIYAPIYNAIGTTPRQDDQTFADWETVDRREDLSGFFASTDADAGIELDLLFYGLRMIEKPDEIYDAEWLPEEMIKSALIAAMHTKRDDIADRLVEVLRDTDTSWQRAELIEVLAGDASSGATARMLALFERKDIRGDEIGDYLEARATTPELREGLLEFLAGSAPALLARLGGDADIGIIQFANAFTSESHAQKLEAIIKPILPTIQGGAPQLRLTLERIKLNAQMLEHLNARPETPAK